jgi:hypothetical protein
VLVLLLALQMAGATSGWAQPPGAGVVAEGTVDGRSRLVVNVPGAPVAPGAFAVTVDGRAQPADVAPILSDRLAMALVVDASAGDSGLQAGLSGLVDFTLAAAPTTRATLVTDTTPPAVVTALQPGPSSVLAGLAGIAPRGDRQTAAALALAAGQLPREAETPRMVVLYTAAPDAPGEPAQDLGARLAADGVVLAVVTTAADGGPAPPYWSTAAAATGGVAVSARATGVVQAFAALTAALRTRYLVTVQAPGRPAPATVLVTTPAGTLSADATLPVEVPPAAVGPERQPVVLVAAVVLGVLVLLVGGISLARLRTRRRARGSTAASAAAPRAWNIPARADPAVEREPLRVIAKALRANRRAVVRPVEGRVGLGATATMVEFVHRNRDAYDIAWWVTAQDPQLVGDQLAHLAEVLGLAAPTEGAQHATATLLTALGRRNRWLLVFDDAGAQRDLARFVPDGPGQVLIGSADPEWEGSAAVVEVPPFTRAESVRLLQARGVRLTAAEAERVAEALDDLPLAVDLAGAALADPGTSVDPYLRLVSERTSDGDVVAAVCAVAFDRLAVDDPAAFALLTLVAWLGSEPVPLTLLTAHQDRLPPVLARQAYDPALLAERAATLRRRGLAQVTGDAVQLHQVPADHLVRRTEGERPGGVGWGTWAVRLLRAAVPPDPDDPAGWPSWRRLLAPVVAATDPSRTLDDVAVDVSWLLQRAAGFLRARGEPEAARALLEDSVDLYRRRLGADHPETVAAANALADVGRTIDQPEAAARVPGADPSPEA